ncbi:MAG: hypothetical protein SNF68_08515 [Rikenellaceae bacterium]
MTLLVLIFGALSGTLLSVFVGLIGRNRRIGFGIAFLLSILLTPLVGLIITLLSEPLPQGYRGGELGCIGTSLGIIGFIFLIPLILALLGLGIFAAAL